MGSLRLAPVPHPLLILITALSTLDWTTADAWIIRVWTQVHLHMDFFSVNTESASKPTGSAFADWTNCGSCTVYNPWWSPWMWNRGYEGLTIGVEHLMACGRPWNKSPWNPRDKYNWLASTRVSVPGRSNVPLSQCISLSYKCLPCGGPQLLLMQDSR